MEHLWAPWRNPYIQQAGSDDKSNLFVLIGESPEKDEENLVISRSTHCFTVMNRYPYNLGHLLTVPYRAVSQLDQLTPEESGNLWENVRTMTDLLKRTFHPDGFNIGLNIGSAAGAGIPQHLHVHIVPRWTGDTNLMTTTTQTRVHPGDLETAYKQIVSNLP